MADHAWAMTRAERVIVNHLPADQAALTARIAIVLGERLVPPPSQAPQSKLSCRLPRAMPRPWPVGFRLSERALVLSFSSGRAIVWLLPVDWEPPWVIIVFLLLDSPRGCLNVIGPRAWFRPTGWTHLPEE